MERERERDREREREREERETDRERKRERAHYFFSIDELKLPNDAKHAVSSHKMLWLKSRIRYDVIVYLA